MKIPKTLKIGGFTWKVTEDQNIINESGVFGSTHTTSQTIFIDPTTTYQKKEQVLLHEIMHAVFWQTGLAKRFSERKDVSEEEIVDALSWGLHQVLKDNKIL